MENRPHFFFSYNCLAELDPYFSDFAGLLQNLDPYFSYFLARYCRICNNMIIRCHLKPIVCLVYYQNCLHLGHLLYNFRCKRLFSNITQGSLSENFLMISTGCCQSWDHVLPGLEEVNGFLPHIYWSTKIGECIGRIWEGVWCVIPCQENSLHVFWWSNAF